MVSTVAAVENIGHLAVNISCNDIASNGIEPLGILLAVMLPVGTTEEQIELMIKQAGETGKKLGVEIIGGHTEITFAVNQPVIVSTAVGRGSPSTSPVSSRVYGPPAPVFPPFRPASLDASW